MGTDKVSGGLSDTNTLCACYPLPSEGGMGEGASGGLSGGENEIGGEKPAVALPPFGEEPSESGQTPPSP